jgi:hypothetical protein
MFLTGKRAVRPFAGFISALRAAFNRILHELILICVFEVTRIFFGQFWGQVWRWRGLEQRQKAFLFVELINCHFQDAKIPSPTDRRL